MTRFYDARNEYDLESVVELLDMSGVEYSFNANSGERDVTEIMVAEEDLPYAEEVLYLSSRRIFCSLPHG
ncbi:MAG: hypothetical protein GJT30_04665 [Geobacter sp.]|nr:hypothetical protein [Geobacter sp.]